MMIKTYLKHKYFLSILATLLGIFYILSGIGKLINTGNFVDILDNYGFGNFSYIAPFICIGEIVLSLLFLFQICVKKAAFFSIIILSIFTIAFTYAHFFKGINDCGCFGEITFLKSSYSLSLVRNLILILLSLIVYIYSKKEIICPPKWKIIIIILITITSSIASGFSLNEPFITKKLFLDKSIKDTPLSNYITTSKDSTYLIFVFSYSCPHCWNATENIKSYQKNNVVDRTIGITVRSNKKEFFYKTRFKPNFKIMNYPEASLEVS